MSDTINRVEVECLEFTGFGKHAIVGLKCSPDGFIQLACVPVYAVHVRQYVLMCVVCVCVCVCVCMCVCVCVCLCVSLTHQVSTRVLPAVRRTAVHVRDGHDEDVPPRPHGSPAPVHVGSVRLCGIVLQRRTDAHQGKRSAHRCVGASQGRQAVCQGQGRLGGVLHVCLCLLGLTLCRVVGYGQGVDRHLYALQCIAAENGIPMPELFASKVCYGLAWCVSGRHATHANMLCVAGVEGGDPQRVVHVQLRQPVTAVVWVWPCGARRLRHWVPHQKRRRAVLCVVVPPPNPTLHRFAEKVRLLLLVAYCLLLLFLTSVANGL